jgi:hypothetical protein
MSAPVRRAAATGLRPEFWSRVVEIRRDWLAHGLSTKPADRDATEQRLTRLYRRLSRARPRFEWVDSPHQALPLVAELPTHDDLYAWIFRSGSPPVASDLATEVSRLRGDLDACLPAPAGREKAKTWSRMPPLDALAAGVPVHDVLRYGVRDALRTSLADGFHVPVRRALGPVPVCWYGQQDASWIAYYDAVRRLGLGEFRPVDDQHLDDWAALARSCGWWWPGEDVCVVVERPAAVDTEPVPRGRHEERRLRNGVTYRDGWRSAS